MSLAANDPRPKPVQIAEKIRSRIEAGDDYAGGRLPPTRELAAEFGVAGQTLRDGLQILVNEGVLISSNRGYFIATNGASAASAPRDVSEEIKQLRSQVQALNERVTALENLSVKSGA